MLSEKTRELAQGGNFAAFTTLKADGQPTAQVMWVDCDEDHILINTETHRLKYKHVLNDPRVAVLIINKENGYEYAEVRGTVTEIIHGAEARSHIDTLSLRYFGRLYDAEQIESERVILKITPLA